MKPELHNHILMLGRDYFGDSFLKPTGPRVFRDAYFSDDKAKALQQRGDKYTLSVNTPLILYYGDIVRSKAFIKGAKTHPIKTLLLYVAYNDGGDNTWLGDLYGKYSELNTEVSENNVRPILIIDKSNFSGYGADEGCPQQFSALKTQFGDSGVEILEFDSRQEGAVDKLAAFITSEGQVQAALEAQEEAALVNAFMEKYEIVAKVNLLNAARQRGISSSSFFQAAPAEFSKKLLNCVRQYKAKTNSTGVVDIEKIFLIAAINPRQADREQAKRIEIARSEILSAKVNDEYDVYHQDRSEEHSRGEACAPGAK